MAKYIDAEKIRAEIERRKKENMYYELPMTIGRYYEDRDLLSFLDTLEELDIKLINRSWYMEGYHDREFNKEPKWIIKTGEGGPRYEENPKYGQHIEEKPVEWSKDTLDEFTENIRQLITRKLTYHDPNGSGISTTVFIDDKTAKDIANGVLFYVGKEAIKNPYREVSEWSEEDEETRKDIIAGLEATKQILYKADASGQACYNRWIDWLKYLPLSLKKRNEDVAKLCSNEWSEEDEEMLEYIIGDVNDATQLYTTRAGKDMANKEIAWLKSLRPSWKPSEEQMKALQYAIVIMEIREASDYDITPLKELYEQIKGLK